ncbi:MAG: dTDP-4-dehydrorhamnose 3,5-epimerase [Candidatus Neomarinimicrobiota bacterium]|tara:strand:- start:702 stop:1250 length:549 start_codon:yes stop_codon:yes gene_type:complete
MMLIEDTAIKEVKILNPKIHTDERGCFFESFKSTFNNDNGLPSTFVQDNEVWSRRGVLRGLHYQLNNPQGKLVRAVVGSILDVAVDIRLGSPTFGKFAMAKLSSKNKKIFYIPGGFAHGYLVTSDESVVLYKCTKLYNPNDEYGIKWDDNDIGINWNYSSPIISEKDNKLPTIDNQKFLPKY